MSPNILFVDDEAPIRELLALYFRKKGFSVTTAVTSDEAKRELQDSAFNLAIVDLNLAGENGLDLLDFMKLKHPAMPVVIFTGAAEDKLLVDGARARGACGFIRKTQALDELFAEVKRHLVENSN